ncbi:Tim44/TimA family putative adaptor protein [Kordiimonas laminariae]|uniref:Tim44/TimA family putative adaptor protein n=1 Tax=Kordiimonas laminariae TaxID=2917717 RepID=UPI001FF1AA1E|nr:Tim44/TimA family putative adaptor protein [Kordiimonas laminariae]MCK0070187.1 Tim44/TimA family putative adaptor protein [Kordiimonas laminariae]
MMDIILLAMVAAFILLRLRSKLGEHSEQDRFPPPAANGGSMGQQNSTYDAEPVQNENTVVDLEGDPALRHTFMDIRRQDSSFDVNQFLDGAQQAYGMILEAFWAGDRETLRNFLDDSVYGQFEAAITSREAGELTLENRIVDIDSTKVVAAELANKVAELTVQFKSEIVAVTRDKDGNVIEGDVSDVVEMNDSWTFSRNVKSRDPRWTLVATRAG